MQEVWQEAVTSASESKGAPSTEMGLEVSPISDGQLNSGSQLPMHWG